MPLKIVCKIITELLKITFKAFVLMFVTTVAMFAMLLGTFRVTSQRFVSGLTIQGKHTL